MRFLSSLIAGAAVLSSLVAAQTLALTSGFSDVKAGEPQEIKYTAADLTVPVTITLRKGNPLNLDTVGVLTSSATGGSYTWTPDTTLTDGDDYALQLTQGDQINYSGQFSVEGGSGSASSSSASASATASSTGSASASSTSSVNITSSILSHSTVSAHNATSSISSSAHNSTSLTTLTSSTTASASAASTTGASSRTASSTGSSSTSAPTNAASGLKSPVALVFGAVAAMAYLH